MTGVFTAIATSAVVGGVVADKASKRGVKSAERTGAAQIAEQKEAREAARLSVDNLLGITRDDEGLIIDQGIGGQARLGLQDLLANPSAGLEEINPAASFFQEQGFRDIREGGSGGGRNVDQDLSRFQTGLTSTLVPQFQNQRFNQLFSVLGLASNAEAGQATNALTTASNIGNIQGSVGQAQQQGIQGQENAILNTLTNLNKAGGAFPNLFGQQQFSAQGAGDFLGARRPLDNFGGTQQGPFPGGANPVF
jgi:hypothetical protein